MQRLYVKVLLDYFMMMLWTHYADVNSPLILLNPRIQIPPRATVRDTHCVRASGGQPVAESRDGRAFAVPPPNP
jgi:hypothetical protein